MADGRDERRPPVAVSAGLWPAAGQMAPRTESAERLRERWGVWMRHPALSATGFWGQWVRAGLSHPQGPKAEPRKARPPPARHCPPHLVSPPRDGDSEEEISMGRRHGDKWEK